MFGTVEKKKIVVIMLCLSVLLSFSACGEELRSYRPIEDVNKLDGRKVGVQLGWASDYILSPRDGDDLILYRYDSTADMFLALYYHQIDAICVDAMDRRILERTNADAIRCVDEKVSQDGFLCYVNGERQDICDNYNDFLEEYHKTGEFSDLYDRLMRFDGLEYERPAELHPNGSGEKIKVAFCADYFPYCFTDADGTIGGYDMEIMFAFADCCDYDIEFVETSYDDMCYGVLWGRYDMGIGAISIAYAPEAVSLGIFATDPYYELPLYLVELKENGKPVIDDSMY